MSGDFAPPPLRALPAARRAQLEQHLLREIVASDRGLRVRAIASLRRSPRRVALGSAAAATLMAAVVVTVVVTTAGTGTASAAEVGAKVAAGLALEQTVSGEFAVRTRKPAPRPRRGPGCVNCTPIVPLPSRFAVGADGSYVSVTLPLTAPVRSDIGYDARSGVLYFSGGRLYIRGRNLDPAAPNVHPYARLGAWVQRALAERSPRIRETTLAGRPAWKLTVAFTRGENLYDTYGARVDVVVDRETGLVLQLTQYADDPGRWTSIATVRNLRIGAPTTADTFTVPRPPGVRVVPHDFGFRRIAVPDAPAVVGYSPLLPTETGGQALSDFAVAKATRMPLAPRDDPRLTDRDVVSARYGDWPDAVAVTTRRGPVTDLPGQLEGISAQTVRIAAGQLVGDDAMVSTSPLDPGLLVAFHDGLIVRVVAPSPADAIAVATSLRSYP